MKYILRAKKFGQNRDSDWYRLKPAAIHALESIDWNTSCPIRIETESGEIIWDRDDDPHLEELMMLSGSSPDSYDGE